MRSLGGRASVAAFAALGLALAVATAAPAHAGYYHGGGWGGGWHGGGWGGGGWGGWHGGTWGGGPYWGPGWGWAGWGYPGWGWGWAAPPVIVVGDVYPANGGGCFVYRKVWTQPGGRGRYLGRYLVNVCR